MVQKNKSGGSKMRFGFRALLALAALTLSALPASAQNYPNKPVRIIVAYPAGGATDVITRAVAQRLGEIWNQQIIIENKGGAGTQIGTEYVAKAEPDGYTLLATSEGTFAVNPSLYKKLSYDVKEFTPITGMGIVNQMLVANPNAPFQSVKDLIAQAKAKPDGLNYGTIGVGSSGHLNMEMFQTMAGVKLTPVHYRGGAPVLTDLIGGHVPVGFVSITLTANPIKAGQLRALGVGSSKRVPQLPEVPTIHEAGVPGFDAVTWFGLFAPSATSADIVKKINADVQKVLADPTFKEKFLDPNFFEPIKGSPEQFADYVKSEREKWTKVVKDANLKVE
jgi:tripartite-type tricarboxylate transporter receptor subunit TctC